VIRNAILDSRVFELHEKGFSYRQIIATLPKDFPWADQCSIRTIKRIIREKKLKKGDRMGPERGHS